MEVLRLETAYNAIANARLTGLSLCQLSQEDLYAAINEIVLRSSGIIGYNLPFNDALSKALNASLADFFLNYGFWHLTASEFLTALNLNAKGWPDHPEGYEIERVQFKGSFISVDFFGRVLKNYMMFRRFLDGHCVNFIETENNKKESHDIF